MVINVAVILVIALIAYWWSNQGFFSALLHFICVVCAAAVAFALWEPLGFDMLLGPSKWNGLIPGSVLLLLFLGALLLFRSITDKVAGGNTRIPRAADLTGGAVFGAASGVVTAGMLVIGTGFIDIPAGALGHTGWGVDSGGNVHEAASAAEDARGDTDKDSAKYPKQLWIPVDTLTASMFQRFSTGSLHPDIGGKPMADWNPHLDRQATLLRTRLQSEDPYVATQLFQAPGTVTVSPPLRSIGVDDVHWWMVPLAFEKKGMDVRRSIAIGGPQVRLVGDSDEGTVIRYPKFWSQLTYSRHPEDGTNVPAKAFFEFSTENPYFYGTSRNDAEFQLLFDAPDDSFEPRFIQIRGTRFDLPDARDDESWEEFCLHTGAVGAGSEAGELWGGDISSLVDMKAGLPRGARPSISDFRGGSPQFSEQGNRILRAEATQVGNKSRGKGKLKVSGYGIERLVSRVDGGQARELDDSKAIIKIKVGPGTSADIAKLARRMGGDGEIRLIDTQGGEYSPYGFELKNDAKTTISYNVPISRWSDIRHRPKSDSNQFALIFVVPVGVSLDRLMLDDERIGFFENITAKPPRYR
ncbi:MAG: hypothetical protein QF561_04515 [Phycisphaerales bacterium]|nr:hypothetical protein [Phycisphaerales bacterium]